MAIIAANWKMNPESLEKGAELINQYIAPQQGDEVIAFVPDFFISVLSCQHNPNERGIKLGCQRLSRYSKGAHTAETSPEWLKTYGVEEVLVGHSEVRKDYEDVKADPDLVNTMFKQEIRNALDYGMRVIYCVGETLEERNCLATASVLEQQVCGALGGLKDDELSRVVIAYEPRWAISDGKKPVEPPCANDIVKAMDAINNGPMYKIGCPKDKRPGILYGGSVTPENIAEIMKTRAAGVLVGGASLDAEKFNRIIGYEK